MNPPPFRKTFLLDATLGLPLADATAAANAAGLRLVESGWPVLDPSEYLAPLADTFSNDELDAAQAALIEDGVFLSLDWKSAYLGREFPMPEGEALRFTEEKLARAAVKFGWAIAYAAELAEGISGDFEVDFSATPQLATPLEHLFIAMGLRSRGVAFSALALRWPGRFEAAVDFDGDVAAFERAVAAHAAVARLAGNYRLSFAHAEEKFAVLPALFREILRAAQEQFAFDKVGAPISTNEEDVRFLPEVPDADLERTFFDEPRGRQLLHVSAKSQAGDPAVRAALEKHAVLHRELLADSLARHLAALSSG